MKRLHGNDLLEYVFDVSRRMAEVQALKPLLSYVVDEVLRFVEAEQGCIVLVPNNGELQFKVKRSKDGRNLTDDSDVISRTILNNVINSGQTLVLGNALTDPKFSQAQSVKRLQLRSIMCVPLISRNQTIGAIYVENRNFSGIFDDGDARPLELLANQAAVSIENTRIHDHQEKLVAERTKELTLALNNLQQAQTELIQQERLAVMGQLAGGVAHELRNWLGVITNAVYFLDLTLTNEQQGANEYLEMIDAVLHESEQIIANLLNLSQSQPDLIEKIQLTELINEVMVKLPAYKQVTVVRKIAPGLPPILADRPHLQQVLTNLVVNANQAMPDGGTLTISASVSDDKLHLTVTDTGQGIAPEIMAHIFEPLFTTKAKGVGLGLPVARNLLAIYGGSILVESEAGKGTMVIVTLPVTNGSLNKA